MGRLPRNKRIETPPPMRLTERDIEIIKTVYEWRIMRGSQLQALFFGSQSTTSYRLSKLYQHGYLDRHFLASFGGIANTPAVYTIGKQGVGVVRVTTEESVGSRRLLTRKQLSPLFVAHTLTINDIRTSVVLAAREHQYNLILWKDDSDLKANYDRVFIMPKPGTRREVSLIPDSYFVVVVPQGRASFFVEADRSSMTVARFREKILAYEAYVRSTQYERRFRLKSLRVLVVVPSQKRLVNLMETLRGIEHPKMFYFTLFERINPETVFSAPIWEQGGTNQPICLIPTQQVAEQGS